MRFRSTAIPGVTEVLADRALDPRGAFLRGWCATRFAEAGLDFTPTQMSLSENTHRHTLRGMHYQAEPAAEQKLVRCIRGAVFDVALDLRPGGALRHESVVLSAEAGNAFFIPRGCAHGFITLTDDAVVEYLIDAPYTPGLARGARWNDLAFSIPWPATPAVISDRDRDWPDHG